MSIVSPFVLLAHTQAEVSKTTACWPDCSFAVQAFAVASYLGQLADAMKAAVKPDALLHDAQTLLCKK